MLGCLEAALQLRDACAAIEQTADRATRERERPRSSDRLRASADRTRRGFTNLERALDDTEDAAEARWSLAARSLGA